METPSTTVHISTVLGDPLLPCGLASAARFELTSASNLLSSAPVARSSPVGSH